VRARWLCIGVVLLLATIALWFAHVYGWLPVSLQVASGSASSSGSEPTKVAGASTSSVVNSTASSTIGSSLVTNSTGAHVVVGVVSTVRSLLTSVFMWLLGDSLGSAIINMAVLLVLLTVVYAVMKFVKYIVLIVVVVGSLLILLRYVLGVV